jgi:cobalt/nickel transport system permease protein
MPLWLSEGLLTLLLWNHLQSYGKQELQTLHLLQQAS